MLRSSVRRPLTAVVLCAALAMASCGSSASDAAAPAVFNMGAPGRVIPSGFVGLSTELWAIPSFAGADPNALNPAFLQLVRNLAPGAQPVVRLGGDSTDWSWWPVPHTKTPPGIRYTLTPQWMQITKAFVKDTHARLIVGIDLEANSRRLASVEAHALVSGLGASSIRALEIGNEPELYGSFGWYRTASGHEVPGRPRGYAPTNYEDDFSSFAKSMPRVPLAGPSTGSPAWMPTLGQFLAREPKVAVATVHEYPLKHCVATNHVAIAQVVADASSDGLAARVAPLAAVAHRHHVPLRIDEINSVSCGGEPGVSDTYATALWSLDTLFALARAGVDGVNIHTPPRSTNQMFTVSRVKGTWEVYVHPNYYGLLMFAQATPPGSRLLRISGSGGAGLSTWATIGPDRTRRVVVINKNTAKSRLVEIRTPTAGGSARLELMRAPAITSKTGITIGGQGFGAQTSTGELAGTPQTTMLKPSRGRYTFTLPAVSAALLTISRS
ncbi:MAG TPA: glycosyl hydrolase family 79 C-terminal domain-containing protein [Solirubrobacteraceae bacterium]|nr:glycosyl hydrolase family 79 C-terminal domain-containing protein [Solirubrobacteraceae bacterium]